MMRLITGVPGAGKTLFAVSEILKVVQENQKKAARGEEPRDIYTNIEGINIPGVTYTTERDWRTFPDGSLVVYDEAHQLFRATGRPGLSDDPVISEMDMHRHRGFDLWFITQFPTKVHHEIRHMVDEHYHLLRQFGAKQATVYKWPEAADVTDKSARAVADTEFFRYPRECFQYYKSASIHTAKLRIPAKIKFLAVVIGLIFSFVAYRIVSAGGVYSMQPAVLSESAGAVSSGGAAERPADTAYTSESEVVFGGCISSSTACRCFTPQLQPIFVSDAECRNYLLQPLPMSLRLESK